MKKDIRKKNEGTVSRIKTARIRRCKWILSLVLAGSLAFSGTACGSSGDSGSTAAETQNTGKNGFKSKDSDKSSTKDSTEDNGKDSSKKSSKDDSKESSKESSKDSSKKSSKTKITDTSYSEKIFDTSYVHEINIEISEEDWADLKENPTEKTKYSANVTIDGETLESVSFATKGNTSLSSVASDPDSDRYSFKLNFGKYVDDQTYYGLNKLNLNNIYADATYMKDYLSYEIFRAAGADAPLSSYVHLSVNGESFGLYLAVEEVGDSYLARTEDGEGQLYKPESEMLDNRKKVGGKDMNPPDGSQFPSDGQMPEGMTPPDGSQFPSDGQMPEGMTPPDGAQFPGNGQMPEGMTRPGRQGGRNSSDDSISADSSDGKDGSGNASSDGGGRNFGGFGGGGFGGFGSSSNGAGLTYTDDELSSYSDIFDNAETDASEEDEARVVAALKQLSEGTDLESCLDTDAIIRYFAAHNFVLNYDSYTGTMLHNYYLYENDGKLSMIPWDYNLSFGGFGGGGNMGMPGMNGADAQTNASASDDASSAAAPAGNDSTSAINVGIDTPLSGATEDARPMWSWIAQNEEYLEKYHEVYDELLKNFFENGACTAEIERVYNMILPYVEEDPTAFYTVDEFKKAVDTLKSVCQLRSESIRKQLEGTLSTSTDQQNAADRVDAGGISLSDMGSQGGGKDNGGFGGRPGQSGQSNQSGRPGQSDQSKQSGQSEVTTETATEAATEE